MLGIAAAFKGKSPATEFPFRLCSSKSSDRTGAPQNKFLANFRFLAGFLASGSDSFVR